MLNGMRRAVCKPVAVGMLMMGSAWNVQAQLESYGPYRVVRFNYADRGIYNFVVDGFGAGSVHARQFGGRGGTVCCMAVPRGTKAWHLKVTYDLTPEEDARNLSPEIYETEVAVPKLPNKHDGYIEFHFLPDRKIEAKWVEYPPDPRNPNTTSNASSTAN
ncbi:MULTISPECIES: DUF3304 domain-containing protein [Burkholderia]|uniref:DUF3304 domain-containing protein n=1 Tax=Burkholderia TaxID=32008 RepID=UPI000B7A8A42|nr:MULTISPECIES: DUF3304 domain-containing protein [Burkholderia]OXI95248.1 hypothetical protein CFB41_18875 [Burkholderia sp. AU33803]PRD91644.1 DUF3304 domain-containing protein [Burkholderia contaminans]